jgi:hypothetical protein
MEEMMMNYEAFKLITGSGDIDKAALEQQKFILDCIQLTKEFDKILSNEKPEEKKDNRVFHDMNALLKNIISKNGIDYDDLDMVNIYVNKLSKKSLEISLVMFKKISDELSNHLHEMDNVYLEFTRLKIQFEIDRINFNNESDDDIYKDLPF